MRWLCLVCLLACHDRPAAQLPPGHGELARPRPTGRRMVPPEAYLRTYLMLFGGLAPLEAQQALRGNGGDQLFDRWPSYLAALGFPDDRFDIPRATQTNAVMIATFEALGEALCVRAAEHDLAASPGDRLIFAFEPLAGDTTAAAFAARFDVLHRTFLGYPAELAPPERLPRYQALFTQTMARHAQGGRLSPETAGWVAVCSGLIRHPEFQVY